MNKHQYTTMQKATARQENLGLSNLRITKPGDNKGLGDIGRHSRYSLLSLGAQTTGTVLNFNSGSRFAFSTNLKYPHPGWI
jgi:hypothetical protein